MLASNAVAALLLAGTTGAADAQMVTKQWYQTYYGCGMWSCHSMTWDSYSLGDIEPESPNVFISADVWFFAPDGLGGTVLDYVIRFVPIYETGYAGYADYGISDPKPPSYWTHDVRYGRAGLEWPEGEVWSETVVLKPLATPEPASLLLLAGGLAGVAASWRRRGRKNPSSRTT